MSENNLMNESAEFAGNYVSKFGPKNEIAKTIVLNAVAHGYYIGSKREIERCKLLSYKFSRFMNKENEWIHKDAQKAAKFYIKKKLQRINSNDRIIVMAAICHGYINGFKRSK